MEIIGAKNSEQYIKHFFAKDINSLENEINEYIKSKKDKPISISYKSERIVGFCIACVVFESCSLNL